MKKNNLDIVINKVKKYEKRKVQIWAELVLFYLLVIVGAEVFVIADMLVDIGEKDVLGLGWIMKEDMQTVIQLSGSIFGVLWEDFPWIKLFLVLVVLVIFLVFVGYVVHKLESKRKMWRQVKDI